jgi:hypothetical protein
MGCGAAPIGNISHTARAGFAAAARQIADKSAPTPSAEADYLSAAICFWPKACRSVRVPRGRDGLRSGPNREHQPHRARRFCYRCAADRRQVSSHAFGRSRLPQRCYLLLAEGL